MCPLLKIIPQIPHLLLSPICSSLPDYLQLWAMLVSCGWPGKLAENNANSSLSLCWEQCSCWDLHCSVQNFLGSPDSGVMPVALCCTVSPASSVKPFSPCLYLPPILCKGESRSGRKGLLPVTLLHKRFFAFCWLAPDGLWYQGAASYADSYFGLSHFVSASETHEFSLNPRPMTEVIVRIWPCSLSNLHECPHCCAISNFTTETSPSAKMTS